MKRNGLWQHQLAEGHCLGEIQDCKIEGFESSLVINNCLCQYSKDGQQYSVKESMHNLYKLINEAVSELMKKGGHW